MKKMNFELLTNFIYEYLFILHSVKYFSNKNIYNLYIFLNKIQIFLLKNMIN